MHLIDGVVTLSPTDLVGSLACEHLAQLELAAAHGELPRPRREDAELDLRAAKGQAHELAYLEGLRGAGRRIVEIGDHPQTGPGLRAAEAETLAAMREGADVIYQAAFFDGLWQGRADFLFRVETPSDLGAFSYEVADTKLARRVKVGALLQMSEYSLQLTRLQGLCPEWMTVVLGDSREERHRVADFDAYHRQARRRLRSTVLGGQVQTYPEPVDHCGVCRWNDRCTSQRRADDHLSLVAGMRSDWTKRLRSAGISTVTALAGAGPDPVADMAEGPWNRLRLQAALQISERMTGEQCHEVVAAEEGLGLGALPEPSPGDLFFDMEGDPWVQEGGLEYLFGVTEVIGGEPLFRPFWAHTREEEKTAFEAFIDFVVERLDRDPSLHVYHYAQYEVSALKKLMGRHGTREAEVDRLLRGEVLVDLYQVVRQGVRVSKEGYGLKKLEPYFMGPRHEAIADGVSSIVAYERYITSADPAILGEIAEYNARDCEATWRLREWLEERRAELVRLHGPLPRPSPRSGDPSEALAAAEAQTRELEARLRAGLPADAEALTPDERATELLARLLDWHRRESKPDWWAFYDRFELTDDELVEDPQAIGRLTHLGEVRIESRSAVHAYAFDPAQEHRIDTDDQVVDPHTRQGWTVLHLDREAGIVEIARGPKLAGAPHPTSLIPGRPIPTDLQRDALGRLGASVVTHGIAGHGPYRAARDLLRGRPPRRAVLGLGALVSEGEDAVEATCRVVRELDGSTLAVQGPPGCGKTYAGARVIVDQVRRGRRVGVCATSHRAISNLLDEVCRAATAARQPVRILQRCSQDDRCAESRVEVAASTGAVVDRLDAGTVDVVAGTTWLFANGNLDQRLDLLVIDEAGQMSLANACAAATAASNLLLLGDPQQLAQPAKGTHPPGAEVSALQHVLAGHDTIPPDRGIFLPETRRLHPDIAAYVSRAFYESRLDSHPSCATRRLEGAGELRGAGLRLRSVDHTGNRTWSPEEVVAVRGIVNSLLQATWQDGVRRRPLTLDDILVVAPYNAAVIRLREALPAGVRVGTVDKFQGQEAAVSIYAMATSSAEDVPRNLDFLFSRNRLNVAVSRAQALTVVVCSPRLLTVQCRTPEQLRLVNALCLYAEMTGVDAPASPEVAAAAG